MTAPFDTAASFVLLALALVLIIGSPLAYVGSLLSAWQAGAGLAGGIVALWHVFE